MLEKTLTEILDIQIKLAEKKGRMQEEQAKTLFLCGLALLRNRQINLDQFGEINEKIITLFGGGKLPYELIFSDKELSGFIIEVYELETVNMSLYNPDIEELLVRLFQYLDSNVNIVRETVENRW